MAVATNQPPIISPLIRAGATLDTSERPIGESISSPSAMTPYVEMSTKATLCRCHRRLAQPNTLGRKRLQLKTSQKPSLWALKAHGPFDPASARNKPKEMSAQQSRRDQLHSR